MDEKRLTRLQMSANDERDISCEVSCRIGGGLDEIHALGDRAASFGRRVDFFGKATDAQSGDHFITDFQMRHIAAECSDNTRPFHARREGQWRFELIFSLHHQDVGKVDGASLKTQPDFFRARRGQGHIFHFQNRNVV